MENAAGSETSGQCFFKMYFGAKGHMLNITRVGKKPILKLIKKNIFDY